MRTRSPGILMEFTTPSGAESFVRKTLPEVKADCEVDLASGRFVPVACLRTDQAFLRDRLVERGIRCYVDTEATRVVSALMVQAGVDYLLGRVPELDDRGVDVHTLVRALYGKMEAKR